MMNRILSILIIAAGILTASLAQGKVSKPQAESPRLSTHEAAVSLTIHPGDQDASLNVEVTLHDSSYVELGKTIETACTDAGAEVRVHSMAENSRSRLSSPLISVEVDHRDPRLVKIGQLLVLALEKAGLQVIRR